MEDMNNLFRLLLTSFVKADSDNGNSLDELCFLDLHDRKVYTIIKEESETYIVNDSNNNMVATLCYKNGNDYFNIFGSCQTIFF